MVSHSATLRPLNTDWGFYRTLYSHRTLDPVFPLQQSERRRGGKSLHVSPPEFALLKWKELRALLEVLVLYCSPVTGYGNAIGFKNCCGRRSSYNWGLSTQAASGNWIRSPAAQTLEHKRVFYTLLQSKLWIRSQKPVWWNRRVVLLECFLRNLGVCCLYCCVSTRQCW